MGEEVILAFDDVLDRDLVFLKDSGCNPEIVFKIQMLRLLRDLNGRVAWLNDRIDAALGR